MGSIHFTRDVLRADQRKRGQGVPAVLRPGDLDGGRTIASGATKWYRPAMTAAKVFMNGRSQAIRLPKEFRVSGTEVSLQRVPQGILIMERDPWEVCREACQELSDDFMQERVQPPAQRRDWNKGR